MKLSQESMKAIGDGEDARIYATGYQGSDSQNTSSNRAATRLNYKKSQTGKTHSKRCSNVDNRQENNCQQCGYKATHSSCPARNQVCSKCHKKGHFAKVCFTRSVNKISTSSDEYSDDYSSDERRNVIHAVQKVDIKDSKKEVHESIHTVSCEDKWCQVVKIANTRVNVQLDTGAKQSLMPEHIYNSLRPKPKLMSTTQRFQSYTKHKISVKGMINVPVQFKSRSVNVKFYVVNLEQCTLLSGEHCENLEMIQRIHTIQKDYPEVENCTGTLPGLISLKINPSIKPVQQWVQKTTSHALMTKIINKLKQMTTEEHICPVLEPTEWISSMVVAMKRDGDIRICLDPRDLNMAIEREHYPIPTIEEVIATIPGSKIFSVLDAKSGYLQIKLDYESSVLTAFNTPIGRFKWLRLPFGIKSAPEIYQRLMDLMLEGVDGARAIMDDILVAAPTRKEHDKIMRLVIDRATQWNLKFNYEKC